MSKLTAEQVIISSYIKCNKLQELTRLAFYNTPMASSSDVNIYLDMNNIIKGLYNPNVMVQDYYIITSTIINLCAHLRSFYSNTCKVNTKFFIVYSTMENPIQTTMYPEYNQKYISKVSVNDKLRSVLDLNLELLEVICPYLQGIYFIKTFTEPAVKILDIICKEEIEKKTPSIIITKDLYAYQLPAIRDDVVIFRPKKYQGQDMSRLIIHKDSILHYIFDSRNKKEEDATNDFATSSILNPNMLSLLMTLSNLPCRNVKSLFSINVAIKKIIGSIKGLNIINGYNSDMKIVYDSLLDENKSFPISYISFDHRFKAIDLIFNHNCYMQNPESSLSYKIDLINDEEIRYINNKYFKSNPLDLNRL